MTGHHDIGGESGFGPVLPDVDEPVFHAEWEKKALALTVGMGFTGTWNIDISRHARERLPKEFYFSSSYYQIWLAGLETLMLENGMVSEQELATGGSKMPPVQIKRLVLADEMGEALEAGGPSERPSQSKAKFKPGDLVCAIELETEGHTRLPRYARGKVGTVRLVHGFHVFPDSNAHGKGEAPHWLYAVAFDARELFGSTAEQNSIVVVDCWEPYLERA